MKIKRKTEFRDLSIGGSVDVITPPSDIAVPSCAHGPMILFQRNFGTKEGSVNLEHPNKTTKTDDEVSTNKKFFSCSAYRDRKLCSFFYSIDDKKLKNSELINERAIVAKAQNETYDHKELYKNFKELALIDAANRKFCRDTNMFMRRMGTSCRFTDVMGNDHMQCFASNRLVSGIPENLIANPLKLFSPQNAKTGEAQFYFSKQTAEHLKSISDQYSNVLGVGTPSLLFQLSEMAPKDANEKSKNCFCLDIDWKLSQVFAPKRFAQFNMCNQFFFTELGQKSFEKFVQSTKAEGNNNSKTLVVIDPPYGVKLDLIGRLVTFLNEKLVCDYILCLPYFMGGSVTKVGALKEFQLSDYRVEYDGHRVYSGDGKRGSPARFFTTIPLDKFSPPNDEDYRLCSKCSKYVFKNNKHCKICKQCTTKDGPTYVHCKFCGECVKPSFVHCDRCKSCHLEGAKCRPIEEKRKTRNLKRQKVKKEVVEVKKPKLENKI
ncbi:rRNA N(6)-adenosine-methyltransferase ZCCHC4-like [Convolutriloba macropyga]|uniref:rRNA N(6)-adenosine-methyltransferase ZCCHC4-like n=1 Tax=Convolutriloba macropyga TaxID=536237 RepID=UPI003F51D57C